MAFDGIFVAPEDDPRAQLMQGGKSGELANYLAYLREHRLTVELKCSGLPPDLLATRSVPPSDLSLLGLVRHLGRVEHYWFHMVIERRLDIERLDADDPTGGFHRIEPSQASVEEAFERWRTWTAYADQVIERLQDTDLGDLRTDRHGAELSIREILVHLIEEYARHCGHADLLRECIDGRTGL